jgi:hypothetical protein
MRAILTLTSLLVLSFTVACSSVDEAASESAAASTDVEPMIANDQHAEVVLVRDTNEALDCTGVLIAPRAVLVPRGCAGVVAFDTKHEGLRAVNAGSSVSVLQRRSVAGAPLEILVLREPQTVAHAYLPSQGDRAFNKMDIEAVGYGVLHEAPSASGKRFGCQTSLDGNKLVWKYTAGAGNGADRIGFEGEQICAGNVGTAHFAGPILVAMDVRGTSGRDLETVLMADHASSIEAMLQVESVPVTAR